MDAIKNSLHRLFTTYPGDRPTYVTYGLALQQFLFNPLSTDIAQIIGETILNGISRFEPRVRVMNIAVNVNFDQSSYEITLQIGVPSLNLVAISLKSTLSNSGYVFN